MHGRKKIITKISLRREIGNLEKTKNLVSYFGVKSFNDNVQKEKLPSNIYKKLQDTIKNYAPLDAKVADVMAEALKNWAIEHGATHYTHWFQPLTGTTAEKHESFLDGFKNGKPIIDFSGKQLIQGEPDASSFPSGGIRSTFEARGYTAWDPSSPAFIMSTNIGETLFIPTAFIAYSGEALDMKTPLLRSIEALSNSAVKLLATLGRKVSSVVTTAGIEQEYFLIDELFYNQRPDLLSCGRTLFGNSPLKGQELSDHYFGSINNRVLEFMQDSEHELYRLGIPIKTRHNEVAPNQFELAPTFATASLAVDQNLTIMSVMKTIAKRHGLRMITHEKPFKGINGSGKHCNWSMADSEGNNLLNPGKTPAKNLEFMIFLAAVIRAIDLYAPLLRISIASLGNDHRLGAHEAPPAILSAFLGDLLTSIIDDIVSDKKETKNSLPSHIELGVASLPPLPLDNTDRNRTSPFAFTGNKFEFRALGANQNVSAPNFTLNVAVADSIDYINDKIQELLKSGKSLITAANSVVKDVFTAHKRVIFNGDGYSESWFAEAEKRGLPNLKSTVDALPYFDKIESLSLFSKYNVLNEKELKARKRIGYERFLTEVSIEVKSMIEISRTMVVPAAVSYQKTLAQAIVATDSLKINIGMQKVLLESLNDLISKVIEKESFLEKASQKVYENIEEQAYYMQHSIRPLMTELRSAVDELEMYVDDALWPLPKYREMLSIV